MRDFIKRHHILMRLFALLMAMVLWVVAINDEKSTRTIDIATVDVQIGSGIETLREKGLVISEIKDKTVRLSINGTAEKLSSVLNENIRASASVPADVSEPGEYELNYSTAIFTTDVSTVNKEPEKIRVVVERLVEKQLPVAVNYAGTLAEGIGVDAAAIEVNAKTVTVTGIESVMNRAESAVVTLDAAMLTDTFFGDCDYIIADADGNELVSEFNDKSKNPKVNITIPVYMTKTIPLKLDIITTGGVPSDSVMVDFNPKEITVTGDVASVGKLTSLTVGEVNLRSFETTYDRTYRFTLPEGVSFAGDEIETAAAHVYFRGVDVREVNVTNITLINIPEGTNPVLETPNLEIKVRATTDKLRSINEDEFRVSVDLTNVRLAEGKQYIPVTVRSAVGGYDIIGSYSVIVNNVVETVTPAPTAAVEG
jgi:hypothetical protein